MNLPEYLCASVLDLLYPERCALCGATPQERPWCRPGRLVAGLRSWDRPHLCRNCLAELAGEPVCGSIEIEGAPPLPVVAAGRTGEDLVLLVGAWKYHGLRGVAWPLASLLEQVVAMLPDGVGRERWLIPVPLHPARQRFRGFNQAAVLARLVAESGPFLLRDDLLRRVRATGQQAKVSGASGRTRNMLEAFSCRKFTIPGEGPDLFLVDDLVTSGATVSSAAAALGRGGWSVAGVLSLGLASPGTEPG